MSLDLTKNFKHDVGKALIIAKNNSILEKQKMLL